jgi:hypothetical protein
MGIDPTLAAAASGATIAGTRGLYSSPIQDLLKRRAIAPRSPVTQAAGEALKENAPVAGLALVQERQRSANKDSTPTGALPVPK